MDKDSQNKTIAKLLRFVLFSQIALQFFKTGCKCCIALLPIVGKVQVCDATGDTIKDHSRAHK